MTAHEPLSARQAELLREVCREYLVGGHEVASAALATKSGWSSATIRSELAALERRGYVVRPHRSAGCRPTLPGLEHYVRSLPLDHAPRPELARAVDRSLEGDASSPEQPVRAAVQVLAEVAGCVAVSFVADARVGIVHALEVVPLVGARALVVLELEPGSTSVHAVQLDRPSDSDAERSSDLLRLQTCLRQLCMGRTLEQAHAEIEQAREQAQWRVDRLLAEALRIGLALCSAGGFDPLWLHVAGQSSLARELAGSGAELVGDVLTRLEDYRRLADVLVQLLPIGGDGHPRAEVLLGGPALLATRTTDADATGGEQPLRLAVVGCRWPGDAAGSELAESSRRSSRMGAIALVGVDRMDYAEVVPLVQYAAKALAARTCA